MDVGDDMWNKEEYQMLEMPCVIRCWRSQVERERILIVVDDM